MFSIYLFGGSGLKAVHTTVASLCMRGVIEMKLSELLISSRLLYLALTRKMNRNTKLVYYGDEYLMEYTGLSKDGYCAATNELIERNVIVKTFRGSKKNTIEIIMTINKHGEFVPFEDIADLIGESAEEHELDYKLSIEQYYTDDSYNTVQERAYRLWERQHKFSYPSILYFKENKCGSYARKNK